MAPSWPQDGPKTAPRWLQVAQDGPKRAPRRLQVASKSHSKGTLTSRRSNMRPRPLWDPPGEPQEGPKRPPRGPQELPRAPKRLPRGPQEASNSPQEAPKRPSRAPWQPKVTPKLQQHAPRRTHPTLNYGVSLVLLASNALISMGAPAFPPRHGVSLTLRSLVEHMLHDVNMCLHPTASTTADQLCMGVAGDAPQALSIRPPLGRPSQNVFKFKDLPVNRWTL